MLTKRLSIDKPLLILSGLLVLVGFLVFMSASLGLLARNNVLFESVNTNQLVLGLGGGLIALFITTRIPVGFFKQYSSWFFGAALIALILVFIPHIGMEHGGAKRWVNVGPVTFQPSEVYKYAFVLFFAAWISHVKHKISTFKLGTLPYIIMMIVSAVLILLQPDTATFGVIAIAGTAMFLAGGARWRDILLMGLIGILTLGILILTRPYVRDRIHTFLDPTHDPTGKSYQIQQSMIAIGSGGLTGRGFGQSVQKFNFLPEPIGDSIFAVAGEEFGFIGSVGIVLLYMLFALRGFYVASRIQDTFARMTAVGIVATIIAGSFINISSMLGIIPLSGIPLIFMSHGGTALFITLAAVGILLNISRYQVEKIYK